MIDDDLHWSYNVEFCGMSCQSCMIYGCIALIASPIVIGVAYTAYHYIPNECVIIIIAGLIGAYLVNLGYEQWTYSLQCRKCMVYMQVPYWRIRNKTCHVYHDSGNGRHGCRVLETASDFGWTYAINDEIKNLTTIYYKSATVYQTIVVSVKS